MEKQVTKNQHYVPRFYMKFFSTLVNQGTKKERALISFYQFKGSILRNMISTTSICSENCFYDEDGSIEGQLAEKEKEWARTIWKINHGEELLESDIATIKEFAIYQLCRTKAMFEHSLDMLNVYENEFDTSDKEFLEVGECAENEVPFVSKNNLEIAEKSVSSIEDLALCILTNKTDTNYITSDAPIVVVNPIGIRSAGLGNIGTVLFFPVSPQKMVMIYDRRLYGDLPEEVYDTECADAFNKYQFVCADERILALYSGDLEKYINMDGLNGFREKFSLFKKTTVNHYAEGMLFAVRSRTPEYFFEIPILKLPNQLKKVPQKYRESFPRQYSYKTRVAILCRIYRDVDGIVDEKARHAWKEKQDCARQLLKYYDYYWNTPSEDRGIPPELMRKLKTVPVNVFN